MLPDTQRSGQRTAFQGAYGFRIIGADGAERLLGTVPEHWPQLALEVRGGSAPGVRRPGTVQIGPERAELWLGDGGVIEVFGQPPTVRISIRNPISVDELIHPFLAVPACIASRWHGRLALHGAAFAHGGRAWALLGGKEAGKSATLACLLGRGHPILSDDVLIVEDRTLFAGPRAVDLRSRGATPSIGRAVDTQGGRPRWRLRPPDSPPAMPLGGFISLDWGEKTRLEPLSPGERLRSLIASSAFPPENQEAAALLALTALPAWHFVRPRGLEDLDRLMDQLVAVVDLSR